MKYELIVTRTQPPCGGKPPKLHTFNSIETNDPIGYVYSQERDLPPASALEVSNDGRGTTTVSFDLGSQHVTYEFVED